MMYVKIVHGNEQPNAAGQDTTSEHEQSRCVENQVDTTCKAGNYTVNVRPLKNQLSPKSIGRLRAMYMQPNSIETGALINSISLQ